MTERSNLIDACRDRRAPADYPAVPAGTVLAPGGVYLDLAVPGGAPFVALRGQVAGSRTRYVARRDVAVERWHALVSGGHRRTPGRDAGPGPDAPGLGGWEDEGGALRRGEGRFRPAHRTDHPKHKEETS